MDLLLKKKENYTTSYGDTIIKIFKSHLSKKTLTLKEF